MMNKDVWLSWSEVMHAKTFWLVGSLNSKIFISWVMHIFKTLCDRWFNQWSSELWLNRLKMTEKSLKNHSLAEQSLNNHWKTSKKLSDFWVIDTKYCICYWIYWCYVNGELLFPLHVSLSIFGPVLLRTSVKKTTWDVGHHWMTQVAQFPQKGWITRDNW